MCAISGKTLAEASRVLRSGGKVFAATPNRFSLGPDPQTGIWCGSWLPEGWTAAMVRRQGGIPPVRHLLSARELNRLLTEAGFSGVEVYLPHIPAAQRAGFPAPVRAMVSGYEVAARMPVSRAVLRRIGPLLHVVARKP